MKTARSIDWLSITLGGSQNWRQFLPLSHLVNQGKGRHGYAHRYQDTETGTVIETGSLEVTMGSHLTLSGDVLAQIRNSLSISDDSLVERIRQFDGRVSRMDLAIDIFGAAVTPGYLALALRRKEATLPCRTWRFIDGYREGISGQSVDTASPKSDRRLRFYDKRAEQGIKDGESWVRLELQLRRLYATSALDHCHEFGVSTTIGKTVGSYLKWSHPDYLTALAAETGYIWCLPKKETNRQRWLLGQVAWALATEIIDNGAFLERFLTSVGAAIESQFDKNGTECQT